MKVWIAQPLRSYTQQQTSVEASGATLTALLADLDRQFPGIRFRMIDEQDRVRKHMRIFVNRIPVEDLATALAADDEVHIFQALSGG
jgi:molybdopterin converting factor small subunit